MAHFIEAYDLIRFWKLVKILRACSQHAVWTEPCSRLAQDTQSSKGNRVVIGKAGMSIGRLNANELPRFDAGSDAARRPSQLRTRETFTDYWSIVYSI